VVADNQYAVLGLMLIATLATVRSVLRPFGKAVEEIHDEGTILQTPGTPTTKDDFGEVVKRDEIKLATEEADQDEQDTFPIKKSKKKRSERTNSSEVETGLSVMAKKKVKRKREKADAFDDLFSGLV
jgi:ribonuclease MRP protein subunit RMP1